MEKMNKTVLTMEFSFDEGENVVYLRDVLAEEIERYVKTILNVKVKVEIKE